MSRLVGTLLRRKAAVVAGQALVFSAIGAIALIFAWMSPSLRESELAVWQSLPDGVNVSSGSTANDPACLAVYTQVTVTAIGSHEVAGHPDLAVAGSQAAAFLGIPSLEPGEAAMDAVAATHIAAQSERLAAHVGVADAVELSVVAHVAPVRLRPASQGTLFVESLPVAVMELYGEPDDRVCLGATGEPVARVIDRIRSRHAEAGLTSATEVFGAVAGLAWTGVLLTAAFALAVRRHQLVGLLRALGQRDALIGPVVINEVAVAALIALGCSTVLALVVRARLLHMWTSQAALVATLLAGMLLTVVGLGLVAVISARISQR